MDEATILIFRLVSGLRSDGIYRANGNTHNVNKLMRRFSKTPKTLDIKYPKYDEYDVASAFKKYIRELPDLLVGDLGDDFIEASRKYSDVCSRPIYRLIATTAEFQTLRKIFHHLWEIQKYADDNKMPAANLAIVWAQNLLAFSGADYEKPKQVIEDLIFHYDTVFEVATPSLEIVEQKQVDQDDGPKVWIKTVSKQALETEDEQGPYDKITLPSEKTVYYICKDLTDQVQAPVTNITMIEVLLNGALKRPMHPNEIAADSVQRWTNFSPSDRENNHFVVTPTKFFYHTEVLSNLKSVFIVHYMNSVEVATLTAYRLNIENKKIVLVNSNQSNCRRVLDVGQVYAYLGVDPKYGADVKNAITFYEFDEEGR
jgi:RhoGAP domain